MLYELGTKGLENEGRDATDFWNAFNDVIGSVADLSRAECRR